MKKHFVKRTTSRFSIPNWSASCAICAVAATAFPAAVRGAVLPHAKITANVAAPKIQALTLQQKRAADVTAHLVRFLNRRISSPGGKMTLVVKAAPRADLGFFNDIYIAGRPLLIKKLRVSDFSLFAHNVRLDPRALLRADHRDIVTLSAQTKARAVISESDLTWMFAQGNTSKEMNLRAKFIGNQIRVSGNWNWGWFSGPVVVQGKLRLMKSGGGNQVWCDISSLKLNGAEVPTFLRNKFSDKLNPLISYDELPFKPNIRTLTFRNAKMIIST